MLWDDHLGTEDHSSFEWHFGSSHSNSASSRTKRREAFGLTKVIENVVDDNNKYLFKNNNVIQLNLK